MRNVLTAASRRTRALVCAVIVLATMARLAVFGTAVAVGRHAIEVATVMGVAAAVLFGVQRAVQGSARLGALGDLHRAAAGALLEGDVLQVRTTDTQRQFFDGNHQATELLATILPVLAADLLASVLISPILATLFPAPVLIIALLLLVVIVALAIRLRRVTHMQQTRVVEAAQDLGDALLVVIDGTLEVVACGAEERVLSALQDKLAAYRRVAVRAGWMSALLSRAPIAAGLLAVAVVVAVDASSRESLITVFGSRALIVAAAIPPLLGCVLGAHAVTRALALAAPYTALLELAPREDVRRIGLEAPELPAAIRAENLSFRYVGSDTLVFEGVSFDWPATEPLVIVGPNGSGKSTLLRLLIGLRAPSGGVLRVDGRDLQEIDLRALRRQVAYLPQRPYLGEPYASVRSALRGMSGEVLDDDAMRRALQRTHVAECSRFRAVDILDTSLGELSIGQRQRVALARLLLQNARWVLLDEPDANLDLAGIALVAALVSELSAAGTMVAVAAHTPELAALATRTLRLGGSAVKASADG